jgi:hypothetical protein
MVHHWSSAFAFEMKGDQMNAPLLFLQRGGGRIIAGLQSSAQLFQFCLQEVKPIMSDFKGFKLLCVDFCHSSIGRKEGNHDIFEGVLCTTIVVLLTPPATKL